MDTHPSIRGPSAELQGRRSERDVLDRLIEAVRGGQSRALVVRGEPGVGKDRGEAIAIGAETLWFHPRTHTDEGVALAKAAGLTVVAKRCMGVTHGWLGLGPGPHVSSVA
jgi:hypothetical protein